MTESPNPPTQLNLPKPNLTSLKTLNIFTKNIGPLHPNFESLYKEASLLNYNTISFSPINPLSSANSIYTFTSHNEISNSFFLTNNLTPNDKQVQFKQVISSLSTKYNIHSFIDIILNQTSIESKWIHSYPNCAFNLKNCPWLTSAYELDKILTKYSHDFLNKKVKCSSAPYIHNVNNLNDIYNELHNVVQCAKIYEYFLINESEYIEKFSQVKFDMNDNDFIQKAHYVYTMFSKYKLNDNDVLYQIIMNNCSCFGCSRFGVKLNVELVSILVFIHLNMNCNSNESNIVINQCVFVSKIKEILSRINHSWIIKANEMIEIAIQNVKKSLQHEIIDLKRTGVRREIIDSYFHIINENNPELIFLCNGWIINPSKANCNDDTNITWDYFMRKMVVLPYTIKLKYSNQIDKCDTYLLNTMIEYVKSMAMIFNGFVIDLNENIPSEIMKHLISQAKEVNDKLIILARVPINIKDNKYYYRQQLGIDAFIEECSSLSKVEDVQVMLNEYCKVHTPSSSSFKEFNLNEELEKINLNIKEKTLPQDTHNVLLPPWLVKERENANNNHIVYDIYPNTPTFYEKHKRMGLTLSVMSCIAFTKTAIGSTKGVDDLYPSLPNYIFEDRLYEFTDNIDILCDNSNNAYTKEMSFMFNTKEYSQRDIKSVHMIIYDYDNRDNVLHNISLAKVHSSLFYCKVHLNKGKYIYKYIIDGTIPFINKSQQIERDINSDHFVNVIEINNEITTTFNNLFVIRKQLNTLRDELNIFDTEVFCERKGNLIVLMRLLNKSPFDYDGYVMISNIHFDNHICKEDSTTNIETVTLPGRIIKFICAYNLIENDININSIKETSTLTGHKGNVFYTKDINYLTSVANISFNGHCTQLSFHTLLPNIVLILQIKLLNQPKELIPSN